MEVLSSSTKKTEELAGRVADILESGAVLALYGDLGSGKTTFTGFLVKALGIDARVQSPTFVIIRRYSGGENLRISTVNHVDLYRISTENEVMDLGLDELFSTVDSITVVEWPEIAREYLPDSAINIYFKDIDEGIRFISSKDLPDDLGKEL